MVISIMRDISVEDRNVLFFCCCAVTQSCLTLCHPMDCSTPGFPVPHCLPEFAQTHVYLVSDAIRSSHPLLSPSPPAFNLSQHNGLFQGVGCLHQVAKVLELQHQSFQWIFRVSFRTEWFDLHAVQGTLMSLLKGHISKASMLWCSAFFMVQLSHLYMTAGKTIALTYGPLLAKWSRFFWGASENEMVR